MLRDARASPGRGRTRCPARSAAGRRAGSARPRAPGSRLGRVLLSRFHALPPSLRVPVQLAVDADVARDLADLLVRDVEPVFAAEGELEVVARDACDLPRLEAEQLADAVILVDDVVARPELGERLERATRRRGAASCVRRRKTCVSGRRARPRSRQTKPRRAGLTANRSSASSGSSSPGSSRRASTRRRRFWVRSASPWCGKATVVRSPPRTSARSSFSASARPRAAIAGRWASKANGCPAGSGSSSTARSSRTGSSCSSSQTLRTSPGCQTKSGPSVIGTTRSSGSRVGSSSSPGRRGSTRSSRRSTAG